MAAKAGLVGEASATIRESNTEETSPLDELIRQIARTTGTYSSQQRCIPRSDGDRLIIPDSETVTTRPKAQVAPARRDVVG